MTNIYLTAKETWHLLFVNFTVLNKLVDLLFFQCVKLNYGRLRCIGKNSITAHNLDVNDQTVTLPLKLKIARMQETRKISRNSLNMPFCSFTDFFRHSNNTRCMRKMFNRLKSFYFLNARFTLSVYSELSKPTFTL